MSAKNGADSWPYRFAVLPIKQLFVDDAYQRPLTSFVDRIEKRWDPALIGTVVTSERSKTKYAVVDGQTRMTAAARRGEEDLPCLVYEGLSKAQEADLFARLQTERRGMVSATRFRAQVVAKDPQAMAIERIVNEEGFAVGLSTNDGYEINAVGALETLYRGMRAKNAKFEANEQLLRDTLQTVRSAWPKMPEGAKSGFMLRGVGHFLLNNADIDRQRLHERLGKVTPSDLARRAEQLREGRGIQGQSPAYMAEAIEAQYRRRG